MRHQAEEAKSTQLLLQKAVGYGELEENARIALSVLGDDGWKVSRIDVDMRVQVFAEPIIREHDPVASALKETQAKFILLREEVIAAHRDQWICMLFAFLVAAVMQWVGLGGWIIDLVPACLLCYVIARKLNRKKGVA